MAANACGIVGCKHGEEELNRVPVSYLAASSRRLGKDVAMWLTRGR